MHVLLALALALALALVLCSASSMSDHFASARRLRQSRSVPSVRTQRILRGAKDSNDHVPVQKLRPTILHAAMWVLAYFGVATLAFYHLNLDGQVKTDHLLDVVYFVVVTTTTVGYGDIIPRGDTAKLLSCLSVLLGMGIVAQFLSTMITYLADKHQSDLYRAFYTRSKLSELMRFGAKDSNDHVPVQKLRPTILHAAMWVLAYFGVATLAFYHLNLDGQVKTDHLLDVVYFVVVTTTTVGYGDIIPRGDTAKLLSCLSVLLGMGIVAQFLSTMITYLADKHQSDLYRAFYTRSKLSELMRFGKIGIHRAKCKFLSVLLVLLIFMLCGTIFLWKVEKLRFVDSFYCTVVTMTTLGYGDISFSTKTGRIFAVFWILGSTVCVGQFFFYLAEWINEWNQRCLIKLVTARMAYMDLDPAHLDGDHLVSAAEYIVYKLKDMGRIRQDEITIMLHEFEDLRAWTLNQGFA
uniref:Potassium channel domain-containing protein n=1 Tax=Ananas comosus var. bracteatus TaxID=296719 RepID=A0A6V7QE47_ANACO|nr:unnamed protein product [Ananas comosus var. bracteatus]